MNKYYKKKEETGFVTRSEILTKRSCNCNYAIKVKLSSQDYFYFCPRCHKKIETIENNKKVINLEDLLFDDIDNLFDYQMILSIGSVIYNMINNTENEIRKRIHLDQESMQIEITKIVNEQIKQDTNSVKKKLLKKYNHWKF